MTRLMIFEPFQPILVVLTVSLFTFAGWKLFDSTTEYKEGGNCTVKKLGWQQRLSFYLTGSVALVLLTSEYWILLLAE